MTGNLEAVLSGLKEACESGLLSEETVYLVGYPKSGNTALRLVAGNLLWYPGSVSSANIDFFVPSIDQQSDIAYGKEVLKTRGKGRKILHVHLWFMPFMRRVVYIVRDPRDVFIEGYLHFKQYFSVEGLNFRDFVLKVFRREIEVPYGLWHEHVGSWLGARDGDEDFLLVKYEDLKISPEKEVIKIAEFNGASQLPDFEGRVYRTVNNLFIPSIEERYRASFSRSPESPLGDISSAGDKKRNEYITSDLNEIIVERFGRWMEKLGYI